MMTLAELLQRTLDWPWPWDEDVEDYQVFESRYPSHAWLDSVNSFLSSSLLLRVLGRIPAGALADLLAPRLTIQLAQPAWSDETANRVSAAVSVTVLMADGWELPPSCRPTLERCVRASVDSTYLWLHVERGLCGVFHGLDAVWQEELAAREPYAPGRTFGPDLRGLVAYLGRAREAGASLEDLEPALHDFLSLYNTLSAADAIRIETVTLVGIVAGHGVGGTPLTEVLSWWGDRLRAHAERFGAHETPIR